ncbi:heavy metal translocating P-type ATPase [Actinomycetospora endophytica]|uniref:Heavy metal translocating P-type ATPase n=1 Tax=Actinomycetospora endophytica TaxID=2291215 RepID=A0ABS8PF20_9PSEU|nr:heavy metal translocating P-type ATPase [Actinomycetospora endophytica]MCD2196866.1 heavy metal translocating P-type ATPase [Actinomycetospora endophytica]
MSTTELPVAPADAPISLPAARPSALTTLVGLPEARRAGLALAAFLVGGLLVLVGASPWAWGPLLAVCYVAGGWEPAVEGLRALRERSLDVDLLMVVAALGAAGIGQYVDGALLIVIFATSGALEAWATARTEESVGGLLSLAPARARRVCGGSGDSDDGEEADADALVADDEIVVRPGEAIAADGIVVSGGADVDQASITGEPLPVAKAAGSEVYAGTVASGGALRVRVVRPVGESVVARIAALVEEASRTKARTQLVVEKVEQRYSVGVVAVTLAVFGVPLLFGSTLDDALLRAMTFMIVASPCALVLATMPPLLAAVATAGRRGLLVRSAQVMERLGAVDAVVLDKTGTLTHGAPRVVAVTAVDGDDEALLAAAAAVEGPSEHPLGRAVVAAARERGVTVPPMTGFVTETGAGVRGRVGGRLVGVGRPDAACSGEGRPWSDRSTGGALRSEREGRPERLEAAAAEAEERGDTVVVVTDLDVGRPLGVLAIADTLREEAPDAVAGLAARTTTAPVLATGDRPRAAAAVADRLGISDVRAGLLPEDKVGVVEGLRGAGRTVAVVGDGVNDAPALAAGDVGVAMHGVELTMRAADVVVLGGDLRRLPWLLDLGRRARRTVVANLVIAGVLITGLVTWDLVGHLPLALGVAGHEGSTILVALNGLRLLRSPGPR